MKKEQILSHLAAIERLLESQQHYARHLENRLILLRDMLRLSDDQYEDLENAKIVVNTEEKK